MEHYQIDHFMAVSRHKITKAAQEQRISQPAAAAFQFPCDGRGMTT
ncbi:MULTISPECIES: hypothetical protein [Bacillus]|nr:MULTISPECIES: hypothetical protein [Bacillus]WFA07608.1 hypothetical protein P3X63_14880 [Bacillus sp. HSf4]